MDRREHAHLIGKVIDGRYQILECVGEGGMGVVYKARQRSIERMVAIKVLSANLARDRNWVQRFYNEAKACSRLHHPNTIRMFDFGQTSDGMLFMAMEFLDGQSLRQLVSNQAPIEPTRVLKILVQCCASLGEAHNLSIIHRDIKGDNIFLVDLPGARDHVKVLDFGVAKLLMSEDVATQVGVVFGTPQYMSPEQGRGEPLTPRSDLYGLGVLAFEMLSGSVPFNDPNPMHVIHMHLQTPVPHLPSEVPGRVQAIVMRALEKDPKRRFASAQEMMDACQSALVALSTGPYPLESAVGTPDAFPASGPPSAAPAAWTGVPSRPGGPPPPAPSRGSPIGPAHAMATVRAEPVAPPAAVVARAPVTAAPSAKTVMVGSVEQLGQGAAHAADGYAADGRTVLLPNSEGVVRMGAGASPARAARVSGPAAVSPAEATASILFWIFCLMAGLAVGVGAYWLVLQLGR